MSTVDRSFDLGGYASRIQGPDDRIIIGRLTQDGQMSDSPFALKAVDTLYPVWFRAVHLAPSGWRVDWRNEIYEAGFTVEDQALETMEPGTGLYRWRMTGTPGGQPANGGMLWVAYAPVD